MSSVRKSSDWALNPVFGFIPANLLPVIEVRLPVRQFQITKLVLSFVQFQTPFLFFHL